MSQPIVSTDLEVLTHKISEINEDLKPASGSTARDLPRKRYNGRYVDDDEPSSSSSSFGYDISKKIKGGQELEELIKNTDPAILVKTIQLSSLYEHEQTKFLDKIGEYHKLVASSIFIKAFNELNTKPLRNALSKFGDESCLPILWKEIASSGNLSDDFFGNGGYFQALSRLKGPYEFIRMIVDDEIKPIELRKKAHDYFMPPGAHAFTHEFWYSFLTVKSMVEPSYFNNSYNDFKLALLYVEKDPKAIEEIFDHANIDGTWSNHLSSSTIFSSFDNKVIPIFMKILCSEQYHPRIREYSAVELRMRNDSETTINCLR